MTTPAPAAGTTVGSLTQKNFEQVRALLYENCGIALQAGRERLVEGRLLQRMRVLRIDSFGGYLDHVQGDVSRQELDRMVDVLTTNKTSFFREQAHFDFLDAEVFPSVGDGGSLRIWSAGCSSGEEPYSLAMAADTALGGGADVRILATDLSRRVLAQARDGIYSEPVVADVPPKMRSRYLEPVDGGQRVCDPLRRWIRFARLNLQGEWPMRGPFDVILCRNVMIYFDEPTRARLVSRFRDLLRPGGHLLIGHSESLGADRGGLDYVQPAVYRCP